MSGYYCRGCDTIKPLFESDPFDAVPDGDAGFGIPCLGSVPFDPELARHCDLGMPFTDLQDTPAGRALDLIARRLVDTLENPQ